MTTDKDCLKCTQPVPDVGSRWCGNCWYPGIDDDYQEYIDLLEDGHSRNQAAVLSGYKGHEEI